MGELPDIEIIKTGFDDKSLRARDRLNLLSKINRYPPSEAIELINCFLEYEKNYKILEQLMKLIPKYMDTSFEDNLIELLMFNEKFQRRKKAYLKVRCSSADILARMKAQKAVFAMLYVLNDKTENYRLRLKVADALGKLGDKQATLPLLHIVSDDDEKSSYVRESATKALGMLGDKEALDPLISMLESGKKFIGNLSFLKERLVEAIGRIDFKSDKKFQVLLNALNDSSNYVRIGAIEALADMEDERAIPYIEKMLHDEDEEVVSMTIEVLVDIVDDNHIQKILDDKKTPANVKEKICDTLEELKEGAEEE